MALTSTTDDTMFAPFTEAFRGEEGSGTVERLRPSATIQPMAMRGGVIVGRALLPGGAMHAFKTSRTGRHLEDLGTLGGSNSVATAINVHGAIVGTAEDAAGVEHAFITEADGSLRPLDVGDTDAVSSEAFGVDAQGRVVGRFLDPSKGYHAFVTDPHGGVMHDLNRLHGDTPGFFSAMLSRSIPGVRSFAMTRTAISVLTCSHLSSEIHRHSRTAWPTDRSAGFNFMGRPSLALP